MINIALSLIKDPKIIIIVALASLLGYLYFSNLNLKVEVSDLKTNISDLKSNISDLKSNITTLKRNNKECKNTNLENVSSFEKYVNHSRKNEENYISIIKSKDKIILGLRKDISNLKKPIEYPEEQNYSDCKIKIKTKDLDENSTLNVLSNIGH